MRKIEHDISFHFISVLVFMLNFTYDSMFKGNLSHQIHPRQGGFKVTDNVMRVVGISQQRKLLTQTAVGL